MASSWRRRQTVQQCLKLKVRPFMMMGTATSLLIYLVVLFYFYVTDDCNGATYTNFICEHYQRGVIDGGLCKRLCDDVRLHKIQLSQCLYSNVHYTVFYWRERVNGKVTDLQLKVFYWRERVNGKVTDLQLKVSSSHLELARQRGQGRSLYNEPARGTSMEQFREMVALFVDTKIGSGDHKKLVDRIMDVADVNHDQKVSLAEAKSIWALMQHNEFFIALVFSDSEYIPGLRGFCGDLFAIEHLETTYLYRKNKESYLASVFPEHYKWGYPAWEHRAKVMVGLLEFTMEAFQHASDGTFYMCSLNEETVGYSPAYDVKISDGSQILSQEELLMYLTRIPCTKDSQCQYSPVCSSSCDGRTGACSGEVSIPTLYHVCQIIKDYLYQGVPPEATTELQALLARCDRLTTRDELEHSLVLNDLKSLLWNKISYRKVR